MDYYSEKGNHYYTVVREDLIAEIPCVPSQRILEIGAGGCDTLVAIKERGLAKEVRGVELFEMPGSNQQNKVIDDLFIGNIEQNLPNYPIDYFDVIICGDVLEHLVDPWTTVKHITRYLNKGGIIIASCPNMREIFTLSKILLKGTFQYQTSGIMDKTHLRFFCEKDMIDMLTTNELRPIKAVANYYARPRRGKFSFIHLGLLDSFFAPQNIVVSKKS